MCTYDAAKIVEKFMMTGLFDPGEEAHLRRY